MNGFVLFASQTFCTTALVSLRVRGLKYLDPADGLLSLHHAYVLGGVPLREQLSGAQVVSSKDNPINQVLWLTWSWNWPREDSDYWDRLWWDRKSWRCERRGHSYSQQAACWGSRAKDCCCGDGDKSLVGAEEWDGLRLWANGGAAAVGGWADINLHGWYWDVESQTPTRGAGGAEGQRNEAQVLGRGRNLTWLCDGSENVSKCSS